MLTKADSEIEWLSDNGSCYVAEETLTFSQKTGLKPVTPLSERAQTNGMAESFVKTVKRDYISCMPKLDVRTALQNLAIAFDHYNESHPNSALKSARHANSASAQLHQPKRDRVSGHAGASHVATGCRCRFVSDNMWQREPVWLLQSAYQDFTSKACVR
jgi:putative transposase